MQRLRVMFGVMVFCSAFFSTTLALQEPSVTEVNRLKIQNLSQRMELAQLKYQLAQKDFDTAKAALLELVQSLQVEGYTFDVGTMTYTKSDKK